MTTPGESSAAVRYVLINWLSFTTLLGALIVLLPLHLEALGLGVDAIAAVSAAAGVGGVISADVVGRLAVRFGAVRLVRGGIAILGLCVVGIGLTRSFIPFVLLHGVIGVAVLQLGPERINDNLQSLCPIFGQVLRHGVSNLLAPWCQLQILKPVQGHL